MDDPERVAAPPPDLSKKLLMATATTAATTVVAFVVKRTLARALSSPAHTAALETPSLPEPAEARAALRP